MQKNVASQKLIVFAFDATTNLPKTGDAANLTAYVSKDYGAVTVLGDTSATEMDSTNAKGYYLFDLTQAETNADTLLFSAKSSTANIVVVGAPATVFTTPANFAAQSIDSNGRVDVIKLAGTTQTARDIGASVLLSNGTGTGQVKLASGYVAMTWADIAAPTTAVNLSGTTISTSQAVASVSGAVGSVTGNVGGNVTGTIGGLTAAALADFFDTDSGTTYASAVAGSVVKEIADNAGGSALTETGIAETVCEYMHTFDTTYTSANVVSGSVMANQQSFAFLFDSGTTYASAVAGSVVKEIADNAGGAAPTVLEIMQGFFTTDTTYDSADIAAGSVMRGVMRAMIDYDTGYTSSVDVVGGSVCQVLVDYMDSEQPNVTVETLGGAALIQFYTTATGMGSPEIDPTSVIGGILKGMISYDTALTYADTVPGSVVYETATNATVAGLTFTVAGVVDANIRYVNSIAIDGVGTSGNPWGPA